MIHEYIDPRIPVSGIMSLAAEQKACGLSGWEDDETIASAPTWQVQRLRRVARAIGRLPWRDSEIRSDALMSLTYCVLYARGAWTERARHNLAAP